MAAGEWFTPRQERRVERAVAAAERATGLEFCVYVGHTEADPRRHAEQLFADAGLLERPAVLILVAPERRRLEVVSAPGVRDRVDDHACRLAVVALGAACAVGDLVGGITRAVAQLADAAGRGERQPDAARLPDLLQS